jgi:isopenicillin N synthase-like dioxygenase
MMVLSATLSATRLPDASLPVIDISGLRAPDPATRRAVASELRAACLDKGFFYIVGHGVSEAQRRALLDQAKRFFDLPQAAKDAVMRRASLADRGYEPMQSQRLEDGAPPDLKEGFYIGVELPLDDPRVVARKYQHGPNLWPVLPGFREVLSDYFAAMLALERLMWRGLALSLALDEDYFDGFCAEPIAGLRLMHYPAQPANPLPNEKGCGAHTDFGGLTLLLQDDNGGLQLWDAAHGWIHAPPLPGTYVVNIGDLLARWTNDLYRSTRHRVVNLSGRARYSVPFFFSGNPDTIVSCLPGCRAPGEPAKYPPTNTADHLQEMSRLSYGR